MTSINKVILVGRLGKDPEKGQTKNGKTTSKFSLATSKKYKTKDTTKEETTWHNIKVFGVPAENCSKHLTKGSLVYIEGSINNIEYKDKETDQKKYFSEVIASLVSFLEWRKDGSENKEEDCN